ncbi:hypothetical protein BH11PLA2_BH11PLA2_47870 [soil metagenome]
MTAFTTRLMSGSTTSVQTLTANLVNTGRMADVAPRGERLSPEPFSRLPYPGLKPGNADGSGNHGSCDRQPWPQGQGISRMQRTLTSAAK